ncbi:hypothetical protein GIB67_002444 [Kingdonia uniflora]|uniref:Uncharacterized protein n=1 Tax=Kingdonia uniflora TaxID=39325 RepID=A0A7J7NF60_9MAGN|nr:hypothetical protein GIB67_002444 [Kingdonia uniflora]
MPETVSRLFVEQNLLDYLWRHLLKENFHAMKKHLLNYDLAYPSDRVRKIYDGFPHVLVPQHLGDDDDMQKISEALGAAKTRVECSSSFLKTTIK